MYESSIILLLVAACLALAASMQCRSVLIALLTSSCGA